MQWPLEYFESLWIWFAMLVESSWQRTAVGISEQKGIIFAILNI